MLDALHSDELTNCAMSPTIKGCKYFGLNTSYNKCLKRNSSFCTCVESVIPVLNNSMNVKHDWFSIQQPFPFSHGKRVTIYNGFANVAVLTAEFL